MGIGEPFENYDEMMDFLRIVNDDNSLNIGARHITVSTSGIVRAFMTLQMKKFKLTLLYAAKDDVRSKLMPINRAYNVDKLMEAIRYYQQNKPTYYI